MSDENAKTYRTVDLARMANCGVQKVRNWEAWGFLPQARRSPKGYRYYTEQHVEAFRVSNLSGFSWMTTLEIMRAVHSGDLPTALAIIDAQQAKLHGEREHAKATLNALRAASTVAPKRKWIEREEPLTIGGAAKRAGVRVSAIRFWEGRGRACYNPAVRNTTAIGATMPSRYDTLKSLHYCGAGVILSMPFALCWTSLDRAT